MKRSSIVLALIVFIAACTGGGGNVAGERPTNISDLAKTLAVEVRTVEDDDLDLELTVEESECIAQVVLDNLGKERVSELGLDDGKDLEFSDLTTEELEAFFETYELCVDGFATHARDGLASGLKDSTADLDVTTEEATCIVDGLLDALPLKEVFVASAPESEGVPKAMVEPYLASFVDCKDLRVAFEEQFRANGVDAETSACIAGDLSDDDIREVLRPSVDPSGEAEEVVFQRVLGPIVAKCTGEG